MNKVAVVSLIILSSISLNACGNASNGVTQIPVKMTRVSVDNTGANCVVGTRPTVKLQGAVVEEVKETSTLTTQNKVTTNSNTLSTKTTVKATTETKNQLDLGDNLPEVKAPPSTDAGSSTQQPVEKPKTKLGQLVDKVKNIFKKKS